MLLSPEQSPLIFYTCRGCAELGERVVPRAGWGPDRREGWQGPPGKGAASEPTHQQV